MSRAEPELQLAAPDVDDSEGLVDAGGLGREAEGARVCPAAGEEGLDEEAVGFGDEVLGAADVSEADGDFSFSFHLIIASYEKSGEDALELSEVEVCGAVLAQGLALAELHGVLVEENLCEVLDVPALEVGDE